MKFLHGSEHYSHFMIGSLFEMYGSETNKFESTEPELTKI